MSGAAVFDLIVQEDLNVGTGQVDVTNPGGGTIRGTRINLQSLAFASYSASWTPGSVNNGGSVLLDIPTPGATPGDFVLVSFPTSVLGAFVDVFGFVIAADTIRVALRNLSGITVNPGTATLRVLLFKTNL